MMEPSVEAVIAVARSVGLSLSSDEATEYQAFVSRGLAELERFMASSMEWSSPLPVAFPDRQPGYRPAPSDDRFNAWLWRCEVRGAAEGPLGGKRVSFKDIIAMAGMPMTMGARSLMDFVPDFDATVVSRALSAGATVVGKNSTSGPTSSGGFGLGGDFERPLNPHNPEHLTGGSSSGSAVAVAAGEADVAFGGDQTGSIRIPASYCGVYGLKPTFGLVSHFGIGFGADLSVDHVGPLARTAKELASALEAVAGYDELDPRMDRTVPERMQVVDRVDDGVRGIRIGLLAEGFPGTDPGLQDAVLAAADVLRSAGAEVEWVSMPEHAAYQAASSALNLEGVRAVFDVGFSGAFARTYYPEAMIDRAYQLYHLEMDRLLPWVKQAILLSDFSRQKFHATAYARAQNARRGITRAINEVLTKVDMLMMPTCPTIAPKYEPRPTAAGLEVFERVGINTEVYGFTGHPALSVPCGKSSGLPIGMQLVGRFYDDPLLIQAGAAYERSVDWPAIVGIAS